MSMTIGIESQFNVKFKVIYQIFMTNLTWGGSQHQVCKDYVSISAKSIHFKPKKIIF